MFNTIIKILIVDDIINFLDFWFHHFPKRIIRDYFDKIYIFEGIFRVRSNLRNITKPLYGDYTLIGYLIAVPYRFLRIIFGLFFYGFVLFFYIVFLLIWIFLPLILLINGFLLEK